MCTLDENDIGGASLLLGADGVEGISEWPEKMYAFE